VCSSIENFNVHPAKKNYLKMDNKSFIYKVVYTTLRQCTEVSKDIPNHLGVKETVKTKSWKQRENRTDLHKALGSAEISTTAKIKLSEI